MFQGSGLGARRDKNVRALPWAPKQPCVLSGGVQKMVAISSNVSTENLCPVCGFKMDAPPRDYNICPSCGTEFGLHDANASIIELREAWIKTGPKWASATDHQPPDWDPYAQLALLGLSSGAIVPAGGVVSVEATSSSHIGVSSIRRDWPVGWGDQAWGQYADRQLALGYK